MEEKLYKFWEKLLSEDKLRIGDGPSFISLYSKNFTTSFFIFEEFGPSGTEIKLEYGLGESALKARITSTDSFYSEALEILERTKAKRDIANKMKVQENKQRYNDEIDNAIL